MNKDINVMNKEKVRDIVYLIMAVFVSIIAVKLMIWLLPVILIVLLACYLYGSMKRTDKKDFYQESSSKNKKKKTIIIDSEDNEK